MRQGCSQLMMTFLAFSLFLVVASMPLFVDNQHKKTRFFTHSKVGLGVENDMTALLGVCPRAGGGHVVN